MKICKHCRHDYWSHLNFGTLGHCCARLGPSERMCSCEQYEELDVKSHLACPAGCLHVQGDHHSILGCQHLTPLYRDGWLRQHDRCECRWPYKKENTTSETKE